MMVLWDLFGLIVDLQVRTSQSLAAKRKNLNASRQGWWSLGLCVLIPFYIDAFVEFVD